MKNAREEERYENYISCNNCNRQRIYSIPVGTTIKKYKNNKICRYCGCKLDGGGE